MKKNLIIALFILLITYGCENKSVLNQINEIESLTDRELFDSAYVKLSKINETALSNDDQKAHYYLLRSQLGILTHHPDSSNMLDSLVIPYFTQKNDLKNLANAYYYKGCGSATKGDYAKATYLFKKAEEQAITIENDKILYKVYDNLSTTNELTGNYKLELDYAKKALKIVPSVNNKKWTFNALYNMAIAYSRLGQKDSSLYYLNKMEPFLKYVPNLYNVSYVSSTFITGIFFNLIVLSVITTLHFNLSFIKLLASYLFPFKAIKQSFFFSILVSVLKSFIFTFL